MIGDHLSAKQRQWMARQCKRLRKSANDSEICDIQGARHSHDHGNPLDVLSPLLVVQIPPCQLIPLTQMKQQVTRTHSDLKPTKTNHSSNQTSWYSVIHFQYYNINFYCAKLWNTVTYKGDTTGSRSYCSVRWGSHVTEQHHITYSDNVLSSVCLYMMIGGLRGNLKPTVTLIAYWDISGHTSSFSASPTTTWGGLCDHQGLIIE